MLLPPSLHETHSDVAVYVVDDGSNDATLDVARAISDDRLTVLSQSNAGPAAARNRGAAGRLWGVGSVRRLRRRGRRALG